MISNQFLWDQVRSYERRCYYMKSDKLTLHIRSYEIKLDQKAQIRLYGIRLYEMRPNDIR